MAQNKRQGNLSSRNSIIKSLPTLEHNDSHSSIGNTQGRFIRIDLTNDNDKMHIADIDSSSEFARANQSDDLSSVASNGSQPMVAQIMLS